LGNLGGGGPIGAESGFPTHPLGVIYSPPPKKRQRAGGRTEELERRGTATGKRKKRKTRGRANAGAGKGVGVRGPGGIFLSPKAVPTGGRNRGCILSPPLFLYPVFAHPAQDGPEGPFLAPRKEDTRGHTKLSRRKGPRQGERAPPPPHKNPPVYSPKRKPRRGRDKKTKQTGQQPGGGGGGDTYIERGGCTGRFSSRFSFWEARRGGGECGGGGRDMGGARGEPERVGWGNDFFAGRGGRGKIFTPTPFPR